MSSLYSSPLMKKFSLLSLLLFLPSLLGCAPANSPEAVHQALERNPLAAEAMADRMIDFVTLLQIHANERKKPITDPAVLRAIDDTLIEAKRMRADAEKKQDAGKVGDFQGKNDALVQGRVLLLDQSLYFGFDFETDLAPGVRVFLAQNVAPSTEEELKSEPTTDLGALQTMLGPQEYPVRKLTNDEWNKYRTVALYSPSLKRIIGIAQLHGQLK